MGTRARVASSLVALVAASGLGAAGTAAAATDAPRVIVRSRVSGAVALTAGCSYANGNGPHMALSPSGGRLSVVYGLGEGTAAVVATSVDGDSWSRAILPQLTPCSGSTGPDAHVGDGMIAVGAAGHVAATESWIRWTRDAGVDHDTVHLDVSASSDGGRSFVGPVEPDPGGVDQRGPVSFDPGSDTELLAAFERVHYINPPYPLDSASTFLFALGGSLGVARSHDGGGSWEGAVTAVTASSGEELATVALLRDGPAVVLIGVEIADTDLSPFLAHTTNTLPERVFSVRSDDRGETWLSPVELPGTYEFQRSDAPATPGCCLPDATTDSSGTLSVAWADSVTNTVTVLQSHDVGASWPTRISVPAHGPVAPAVATRSDGSIGVFFYDSSPASDGTDMVTPKLAVSRDGGKTWPTAALAPGFDAAVVALSACPTPACDGTPMGPYEDLIPTSNGFAAVAAIGGPGSSGGGQEDVWFIRVSI